jgi:hypothetical protein
MDPHLNCVPSLHILIVTLNWMLATDLIGRLPALRGFDAEGYLEALRGEALAITESVLFVKQHSVNCIGASLFYLRRAAPSLGDREIRSFVRDLFRSASGLSAETAEALRGRMIALYEELDLAYLAAPRSGWRGPVLSFIRSCLVP